MRALIVADMLNDYVTGASVATAHIIPAIRRLIDHARVDDDWLVVYANDARRADDREMAVRGRQAMAGTPGAAVIEALAPIGADREIVLSKRHYGAFEETDLDDTLFDYDVTGVVLAGQHLDIGLRHTAYGAFLAGLDIFVPGDAVRASDPAAQNAALAYLKDVYGATLTSSTALIGRPVLRTAAFNPGL